MAAESKQYESVGVQDSISLMFIASEARQEATA